MNTHTTIASSLIAAAAFVGVANAEMYSGNGAVITDNNTTGKQFTINVADSLVLSDVSVSLNNFRHDRLGDLVATLRHVPSSLSITLFDRVGKTTSSAKGDDTNFNGTYTFADNGGSLWSAANAGNNSFNLSSATYYATAGGIGSTASTGPSALSFASTFGGIDAQGDWILEMKDLRSGTASTGTWTWSLNLVTVPAPGAMALIGAAGVVGFGRRRR
jgi:subtilisin-like proprotein convertase family protein